MNALRLLPLAVLVLQAANQAVAMAPVVGTASSSRWDPLPSSFGPFVRLSGNHGTKIIYSILVVSHCLSWEG